MFETCDNCDYRPIFSRRDFLSRLGMGMGALGLGSLLNHEYLASAADASFSPLAPKDPQFPVKAKRVIHIFANGGPSQVDTFDNKPIAHKIRRQNVAGGKSEIGRKTGAAMAFAF